MQNNKNVLLVKPGLLRRLIGAKTVRFSIDSGYVIVDTAQSGIYRYEIALLPNRLSVLEGKYFSKLTFKQDNTVQSLSVLSSNDVYSVLHWLQGHWVTHVMPQLIAIEQEIDAILALGYPRTSRLNTVKKLATECFGGFSSISRRWARQSNNKTYKRIADVAFWAEQDYENLRNHYVETKLQQYEDFFNSVESKPLTPLQRRACIVDEDNNLVLAGAGTGKTSVMIGRAGFLLAEGQASASDILMLAYGNEAAKEMNQRFSTRLGDKGVSVSTFHKLGKDIIAAVEGKQPSVSKLTEDEKKLQNKVNSWFEGHLKNKKYQDLVFEYYKKHLYEVVNSFDFKSESEYFEYLINNDVRTLNGEKVKSFGELDIANYLFVNGIKYIYEHKYSVNTATLEYGQYQPDFYLPDYDIYIEFFGIDRNGKTAPKVDQIEYHKGIEWKRALHTEHGTTMVELFYYDWQEKQLENRLNNIIADLEIKTNPISDEDKLNKIRDFGKVNNLSNLLAKLMLRYKSNFYDNNMEKGLLAKAKSPIKVQATFKLLKPLLDDYESYLKEHGEIDFDDMIGKAIQYVKAGKFKGNWKYIMVDEFQDISEPRARLIQYLRDSAAECSLFCVGDDWQAIYRFAGSDLTFTTKFEQRFGATKSTPLDLTFRFNSSIGAVASKFILKNKHQIRKNLKSLREVSDPSVSIVRMDNRSGSSDELSRLKIVLDKISTIAEPGSSVYLLSRYKYRIPSEMQLDQLAFSYPALNFKADTMHASKGKEAEYVVILDMEDGAKGFPARKKENEVLELMLPELDDFPDAEERRLFYVALTRAKHRVYILVDMAKASSFILELLEGKYVLELDEFTISQAQKNIDDLKCIRCKIGTIIPKASGNGTFYACTRFPFCKHKEDGCDKCKAQMRRVGRFKICLNDSCNYWAPECPVCKADMVERKGRHGTFWGCSQFREQGCRHTENDIQVPNDLFGKGNIVH